MPNALLIRLGIDSRELQEDIERVKSGELEMPTVSAFKMTIDERTSEDVAVYLDEA